MAFDLNEEELKELTDAFKQCPKEELPCTTTALQEFVDKYVNTPSTVANVIEAAVDDDKQLTQEILESAGVRIRPIQDATQKEIQLHMAGLWDSSLDMQQYEDTKNSYMGSKFILWLVQQKEIVDNLPAVDPNELAYPPSEHTKRNQLADFLPPVDVALKIYRIDTVDVRDNIFTCVFSVLLDWEDPSLSTAAEGGAFVAEQHFCPKYSIDNCDSSALIEVGDGRKSHPRRDQSSWHVKWTSKFQATLKTPLNPEKYPFDFQELRIAIKPNSVDSSMLSFLDEAPYNFKLGSRIFVEFQHPLRWRRHSGHNLDSNADWLPDFDICGLHAERDLIEHENYTVLIGLKRDPTNIILNVLVSMTVTSVISSFSFFISEFADALAVVLTALLTAVAFKLILAEQLPLTPKPSAIETYVTLNLFQFALQAILNCITHLATSNLAEGLFKPKDDFTCTPEVEFYQLFPTPVSGNATTPSLDPSDPKTRHLWWCNMLVGVNITFFFINVFVIVLQTFNFLRHLNDRSQRQLLAESTWGCVHADLDFLISNTLSSMIHNTRKTMRLIAHDSPHSVEEKQAIEKKKSSKRIVRTKSEIDKALFVRDKVTDNVPSIYSSPSIRCFFTMGTISGHRGSSFKRASLASEEQEKLWCSPNSGVNPWEVTQRLAKQPCEIGQHYKKVKFKSFTNVQPQGRCMASLLGATKCPLCDAFEKGDTETNQCRAPRTWVIGARRFFANPHSRCELVHEEYTDEEQGNAQSAKVAPASSLETKKE